MTKKTIKKPKLTPQEKSDKEKSFTRIGQEITPHPTPSPSSLKHIGLKADTEKRHRRTKEEIQAEKDNLAAEANPMLSPILKMFFTFWAKGIEDNRIELTDKEANNLALPITQLMEYYLPNLPAIWFAWGNLGIQVTTIITMRLNIIKELKEKKNANTNKREQGNSPIRETGVGQKFPSEIKPERV